MKRLLLLPIIAGAFVACQQPVAPESLRVLGALELTLDTSAVNTVKPLGTLREGDATFTALNVASVNTDGAYDYLQAQFTVQNTSSTTFDNLTLYAVARDGNIGGTALKNITDFGGTALTDTTRARATNPRMA
ncbi:MAG: hypothetical protein HC933_06750 [Pleurocapsa sp. SU_196_0]|nr:hypothetical protein [Pleurocapsa sp. SU_196_0]